MSSGQFAAVAGFPVRAVDLDIDHRRAAVQIDLGYADQSAHHRLAELERVGAVILDGIARNGAVGDLRSAVFNIDPFSVRVVKVVIRDAHQSAERVGAAVVTVVRARRCTAFDRSAVVTVEHDVSDLRARRRAENADIVAGRVDVDVLDVVVIAVVHTAEPTVEVYRIALVVWILRRVVKNRTGDGMERGIFRADLRKFPVCAVEVMRLLPAAPRTIPLRRTL